MYVYDYVYVETGQLYIRYTAPSIIQTVKNSVQLYIVNVDLKLLYLRYILDKGHSYPYQ